jgi:methionyl-tRNA formyltransferase
MEMEEKLDSGPVYVQRMVAIDPLEDAGSLSGRLSEVGASLLLDTLRGIDAGTVGRTAQPEEGVTFAPRLEKKDGLIPWEKDAESVHNHIRGMNPWPGSFTYYRGGYLKIHRAEPLDVVPHTDPPGSIVESGDDGILVACGSGTIALRRLQAEGKRPLDAGEFSRGFPLEVGAVLGGEQ